MTHLLRVDELDALLEQRRDEVATGKKSLIGTNVYAELDRYRFRRLEWHSD